MKLTCQNCGVGSNVKLSEGCCTAWMCGQCMVRQTYCTIIDPIPTKTIVFKPLFKLGDEDDKTEEKE